MTDIYDSLLDQQEPSTTAMAPVAPAGQKDAYDTILDEFSAKQDAALKQSLDQAMSVLPQQAATTQQLAKASGLPEDLVERNKDLVQKQVKMRELQSLLASSPVLSRQMQDPAFAKLAQNDANTLSTIERLWRQPSGGAVEGLGMGTAGIGDTLSILQRNFMQGFANTFLPTPIGGFDKVDKASLAGPLVGQDWQTVGNYLKAQGRDIQIPQLQQQFFDKVLAGIGQVGAQIVVGTATGGGGSAAFLYGQGVNSMTEKTANDPGSQGSKDLAALLGGGVTAVTEKWALDKLLGPMAVPIQNQLGAALARVGIAGTSEGAQETIESIAQDSLRKFLVNPDAPIQIGQAFEEGGVGFTVGALVRSVVEAATGVRNRTAKDYQQAMQAEQNTAMIEQLNKLAAASELLQTSPEAFQQFIEQAAADGDVTDLYIDAAVLMQSGVVDELAALSPAIAEQLPTAMATGGTVRIPAGEYAAKIAPSEFAAGLLDHLKTDPMGFTRPEAQEFFQNFQAQMEEEIAQFMQTKTGDQDFMDSKERVKQTVLTELNDLGRFTPQKNELDATLIAARTAVRAAQLGMTPEAFFEKQRLSFAAERIDGQQVPDVDVSAQVSQIQNATDRTSYVDGVRNLAAALPNGSTITDKDTGVTYTVKKFNTKQGTEIIEFDVGRTGENSFAFNKKKGGEWVTTGDLYFPKDFEIKQPKRQGDQFSQDGQLQTDTPAFQNWFGDSKVTDESGKPIVVYHGTITSFDTFSSKFQGAVTQATSSKSGFFFTDSPRTAQSYADYGATVSPVQKLIAEADKAGARGNWDKYDEKMLEAEALESELADPKNRGRGQNVMPVYLNIKNPLIFDAKGETPEGIGGIDPLIQRAKKAGHDGVIIRNFDDAAGLANDNSDHYIAFEPTQIKSAVGNRGTFDPNDPNILNQSQISEFDAVGKWENITEKFASRQADIVAEAKQGEIRFYDEPADDGTFKNAVYFDKNGNVIGTLFAGEFTDDNKPGEWTGSVEVKYSERRKGIATELYDAMENTFAVKMKPAAKNSTDAAAFWRARTGNSLAYINDVNAIDVDEDLKDLASELLDNGAQITPRGEVRVFHRTSKASSEAIKKTGMMTGKEDGLFFSTKADGQITDYGDTVVELHIPLSKLQLDDVFGDEAHVRVPMQRAGQKVNVRPWQGEFNQFAGIRSRTADLGQLEVARAMADDGRSANVIQERTGWMLGVDGMWRYEISDDQARFSIDELKTDYPYVLEEVLDHPELFAAYPGLRNINVLFKDGDEYALGAYFEQRNKIEVNTSRGKESALSTLLHEIQHAIQAREGFARGGSSDTEFVNSVKEAVARLKEQADSNVASWKNTNWDVLDKVKESTELARNALKYQSAQRLIDYSKRDKPSGVFRLIRNEMQWIYGEQFYGNREANDIQRMFYDLPKKGDKRNAFLSNMAFEGAQFLMKSIPAEQLSMFKNDPRKLQSLVKALDRQASSARKEMAPLRDLEKDARAANYLNEKTKYKTSFDVYNALAGEIEARTTQARQQFTAEERRMRPVRFDNDVDPSQAIVIMGGREMKVPSVMNSMAPQGPRGSYNPNTNTIALMKGADLSTFLHEAGHYFFESDIALATEIVQGNALFGAESMTQGESEILNDVSTLFTWFGFEGDIAAQLAQWNALSFEQKRGYHEKTAESFERYLFEGKAPSIELQSYFQQFRAWLVNVYKSIKDFVTNNPAAGELTDEVRAVFDRMLATNEEIQLAEQARSMMPLFRTKQDADNIGMTPDEFKAYQKQDVDATNEAIQDMQARAVRDLQWTRNAHNREVKRLQRQAGELRAAAKDEARAQVLDEPLYKAWQFLTRKLEESDKVVPVQRPKTDPNVVEPMVDSMFTAIAKLGGLNKQEAMETWGVEEAERPNSGVFGKPVLRVNGGKSIDGMVEALAQYGYLPLDENGKADIADFETKFDDELRGDPQYSVAYDYSIDDAMALRPGEQMDITALTAGRFDIGALMGMDLTSAEIELLKARRMTAKDGLHPDLVAELPGIEMSSGDELVRKLLAATPLKEEIEARAETIMLERHGELASPEAIAREADKAIHSEARAKMVATEANALARATGERKILAKAAKALAETMVARVKVRDIKPTQYASAEARAAKNAVKASNAGDLRTAAAEKRSQLVNTYATRAAYNAQDEINAALRYLKKFEKEGSRKGLDIEYLDQIDVLLERFDLRKGVSLKALDKRESLAKWIAAQEEQGFEPDLPEYVTAEANRVHYKNLTVEEFRGLVESVKQIEHLGRLKKKLLTAKDQRDLDAIVDEIKLRIEESSGGRTVNNEVRNTFEDKIRASLGKFLAAHRKAASVARELDGFEDGGPMWEYFTRSMNEAGDYEVTKRAETAKALHELAKPILAGEDMGGKGRFFPSLNRSVNRGEKIAMALNWGNDSNRQRLLGGKGWTAAQVQPVLDTMTAAEWQFVQGVWDLFESFRPEIAAKERRVSGKEPEWIEAVPLDITTADGQKLQLRGGYYPVKFDPLQSGKVGEHAAAEEAKQLLRAAYTAATTRRSFTKSRAAEVYDRPLLLSFDGIYQGMNEVIHDLAWHEWLIDANKLLRKLDGPIRTRFGANYVDVLKKAKDDIARGDTPAANEFEKALSHVRNGSTIVGMGWNITTALMQPLGFTQSAVRIGGKWIGRGMSEFFGSPSHMIAKAEEVQAKSKLMANRALTLNREINDVRNRLETNKSDTYQKVESTFFIMIQKMQAMVDYPTWLGAYDKALADPANDEARAIALADQAVLDAQGGGQTKDLALVQRGSPLLKLFTNFYSYFNVLYNLTTERTKQRVKAKEYGGLLTDYTLLMIVPAVMSAVIRNATKGEDDEDEYMKAIAGELVGYPFGMFLGVREMAEAIKLAVGLGNPGLGYSGPAGLRFFNEVYKLGQQAGQGELDWAFFKAANNTAGILFHYPAGQINRLVEGVVALMDDKTDNPLAPLVGVKK